MTDPRVDLGPQLTGAAVEACREALDRVRPIVRLDRRACPDAATAAAALVHLLGRLHPHTTIDGDASLGPNPWSTATLSEAAASVPRPQPGRPAERDIVIGVGRVEGADFYVGGDDWTGIVADTPIGAAGDDGAFGVHAAAAIAAAEVLKIALEQFEFVHASARPETIWNLLDYRRDRAPAVDAGALGDAAIGTHDITLFGAGSVGSSVAALLSCAAPTGSVDVVDADHFDPIRNPYRYPAATGWTAGSKAEWAAAMLSSSGWPAVGRDMTVSEWVSSRSLAGFDGMAVSSVDRVDSRADVADALARTTLSIGVGGLAFHVQREEPDGPLACPYCQYLTVGTPMSQLAVYEEQTGIPMARIAELLKGTSLVQADVDLAVSAGRIHADRASELLGRRFEDLIRRAYAQATVHSVDGGTLAVSAPSVSWLAGAVAAAEIRKAKKGLPLLDRRIDVDMSGVPTGIVRRVARDRSGRCLCANPFRVRAARRLYGTQRPARSHREGR